MRAPRSTSSWSKRRSDECRGRLCGIATLPRLPNWSWPEFAIGALVGLLAASVLWFVLRVALFVLLLGLAAAAAFAVLGGMGKLHWLRWPR
jgi:CDP-diglyceride synthetase